MRRPVKFALRDGGANLIQVDEATADRVTRSDPRRVTEQARQTSEQAIVRRQAAAQALSSRPQYLAAASSTANSKVTLSWQRRPPTTATSAEPADGC